MGGAGHTVITVWGQSDVGLVRDNNELGYAAWFLEACMLPAHTLQMDSQGLLFQESVSIMPERVLAVKISNDKLLGAVLQGIDSITK